MSENAQRIAALSPEQREILLQRLRRQQGQAPVPPPRPEQPRVPEGPVDRFGPTPMTDVQEVYWAGRSGLFDLGGCAANVYVEYDIPGAVWPLGAALNAAIRRVVARHEILRTVVLPDGRQQLLPEVPPYEVEIEDLSGMSDERAEAHLRQVRDEMRYARRPVDRWPLFNIVLHQLKRGKVRLHARFDALIIDGRSRGVLIDEIAYLVHDAASSLPEVEVSYLDHSRALAAFRGTETWRRAREYWLQRVPSLPPPPRLPLARPVGPDTVPRIVKREFRPLAAEPWQALKRRAAVRNLTPTGLLTAAFVEALRPWTASPDFTLGLMGSYRPPTHPEIRRVIGNFNTVHLLAAESGTGSFGERAQRLQRRLNEDLQHQHFSGHRVLREWRRQTPDASGIQVPVLFDSVVEYSHARYRDSVVAGEDAAPPPGLAMTEVDLMISLPQVLIMCVAVEDREGGLILVSQAVEELFPEGLVPAFCDGYCALLARLAAGEESWEEASPARLPDGWSERLGPAAPGRPEMDAPPEKLQPAEEDWSRTETAMADLWEELLGQRPPSAADDFFALGGDSLLAVRLLGRAREVWGPALAAQELLAHPTLAGMSAAAERTPPAAATPPVRKTVRPRKKATDGLRIFSLIWIGQLVSALGTGLGSFALGVWVYENTGSVTQLTLVAFFASLTSLLLTPVAGSLADRIDRRTILIAGNVASAATALLMATLLGTGQMQTWHVYPLIIALVTFGTLQGPAFLASVSSLVPRHHLARASGMSQISQSTAQILGPLLAGLLVGVIGYHGLILIDASTFLFAALTLTLVRIPGTPEEDAPAGWAAALWQDALLGWRLIRSHPGLVSLMLLFALTNFSVGMVQVLLTPLVLSFTTPAALGTVNSIAATGAFAGGLALSVWGGPRQRVWGILLSLAAQGAVLFAGGLQASVPLIAAAACAFMLTVPIINGCNQAIWQSKVALAIQGRVFAIRQMLALSALPLAHLLAGPLADQVFNPLLVPGGALADSVGRILGVGPGRGVGLLLMTLGAFMLVVTALFSLNPRLRRVEDEVPDALTAAPEPSAAGVPEVRTA